MVLVDVRCFVLDNHGCDCPLTSRIFIPPWPVHTYIGPLAHGRFVHIVLRAVVYVYDLRTCTTCARVMLAVLPLTVNPILVGVTG